MFICNGTGCIYHVIPCMLGFIHTLYKYVYLHYRDISEELMERCLYTGTCTPPDLVIRT
uniref:Uncharacterized protein n=1 Tax=Amphimedon queenslandica TaxID=400682 RepID=A0A1X7SYC3_AMPQE